ncbi:hypothetical protein D3C81_1563500 [compost metagenome]
MIVEHRIHEGVDQLFLLFVADRVALQLFARTLVAVCHLRIEVCLVAAVLITPHARQSLDLPPQQIDLLVVLALLDFLGHQPRHAHLDAGADALHRISLVPLLAVLPAVHRRWLDAQHLGDAGNAIALPVERACNAARLHFWIE